MSIKEYFDQKKSIQRILLEYLEEESNSEGNYENFNQVLKDQQILNDSHEIKELLYLMNAISNSHQRNNNFFNKIERILERMKNDISKSFQNSEIFEILKTTNDFFSSLLKKKL